MVVDGIAHEETADGWRLSASVRPALPATDEPLYFEVHGAGPDWLAATGDAFLAALLLPAMGLDEELVIEAPVSRRLLRSARTVMDIYAAWWGDRHRSVPLKCAAPAPAPAPAQFAGAAGTGAVGLYFTAGVDSFYSLLKDVELAADPGHDPVTHLLFANFERRRGPAYDRLLGRLRRAADQTGRRLVVIETNVRSMTERAARWPDYHGAALASAALALQGLLGRCLIAASDQYGHLPPLGSHPVLDHLWSTETLEIVHDGAEASRAGKVARQLARSRLALETLTVCWRSEPARNCGACEKCLRTMVALELAGSLGRCATLPRALDIQALRDVRMWGEPERDAMGSVAADARSQGRRDIADAIEDGLRRHDDPPPAGGLGGSPPQASGAGGLGGSPPQASGAGGLGGSPPQASTAGGLGGSPPQASGAVA